MIIAHNNNNIPHHHKLFMPLSSSHNASIIILSTEWKKTELKVVFFLPPRGLASSRKNRVVYEVINDSPSEGKNPPRWMIRVSVREALISEDEKKRNWELWWWNFMGESSGVGPPSERWTLWFSSCFHHHFSYFLPPPPLLPWRWWKFFFRLEAMRGSDILSWNLRAPLWHYLKLSFLLSFLVLPFFTLFSTKHHLQMASERARRGMRDDTAKINYFHSFSSIFSLTHSFMLNPGRSLTSTLKMSFSLIRAADVQSVMNLNS